DMGRVTDGARIDLLAFSGHRMHAPYGAGILVGPASLREAAEARRIGGGAVRAVARGGATLLQGSDRHEAGSPNVTGAVAIAAAASAPLELRVTPIARPVGALLT